MRWIAGLGLAAVILGFGAVIHAAVGSEDFWDVNIADLIIALFTVGLVVATGFLWDATRRLWLSAEKQLEAFRESLELGKATAARQSDEMQTSLEEAARSASAMEDVARHIEVSAKAAQESVAALKERTAQQMRAYVSAPFLVALFQERARGVHFEGRFRLVNTGLTPARNVAHRARAAIMPFPLPSGFDFPLPDGAPSSGTLGSHQEFVVGATVESLVPDSEVESIKSGRDRCLYVWGTVTYEDIFGAKHFTNFCQHIHWGMGPEGAPMGFNTLRNNDAD